MGKKQHSKDRMYLTTKEWKYEWGGYKDKAAIPFKRLPFHCCAITFTPFEDPVCTEEGTVYDVVNVVPYVMKFKRHPVSGEPLQLKDLIKLNFHKNSDGEYHCPVMNKVFTEHTHIVAVKPTGNVYCYEAVEELCVKAKNWKDLLTDEPFTRKDIIHIQDPLNLSDRAIENFDHVKRQLAVEDEEAPEAASSIRNASDDMKRVLGALSTQEAKDHFEKGGGGKRAEATRLLADAKFKASGATAPTSTSAPAAGSASAAPTPTSQPIASTTGAGDWRLKAPERSTDAPKFKPGGHTWDTDDHTDTKVNKKKGGQNQQAPSDTKPHAPAKLSPQQWYESQGHVRYEEGAHSTGAMSRGFTSTSMQVATKNQRLMTRHNRNPTKKGYVRLHTTLGDLNLELHCDIAPRTCENFIGLCIMGYYNNTIFHRSIKNFMIQAGDPLGTGLGGESIYGKTFKDELDSRLVHNGRGILSMANSGPNTNGSQFFITYKSARHLDFKHSVFGRVVGGLEVLSLMERVPTDEDDRPLQEMKITGATVFTNPYQEMEDEEKKAEEVERKRQLKDEVPLSDPSNQVGSWFSNPSKDHGAQQTRTGVGKYISTAVLKPTAVAAATTAAEAGAVQPAAKKPKVAAQLSNFDNW